jgi:SagB-type dehydrogenase family enzyme
MSCTLRLLHDTIHEWCKIHEPFLKNMRLNFGDIFHKSSKDRTMGGLVHIPLDTSLWPLSWKTIEFKTYPNQFPKIQLPAPALSIDLGAAILKRRSVRAWRDEPISLQELSNVLFYSCGTTDRAPNPHGSHRAQASAGRRFPLEIYVANFKAGDLRQCLYHYNPETHTLDELWDLDLFQEKAKRIFSYEWAMTAACGILITAVVERSVRKYGERAYRYMYMEAGAIANMMNVIGSTGDLGSVILGGTNDKSVERVLDIDGETETLFVGIALGKK